MTLSATLTNGGGAASQRLHPRYEDRSGTALGLNNAGSLSGVISRASGSAAVNVTVKCDQLGRPELQLRLRQHRSRHTVRDSNGNTLRTGTGTLPYVGDLVINATIP